MDKQFVNLNIAKKLKSIGFDEFCLAYFEYTYVSNISLKGWQNSKLGYAVAAPLWQQVIEWLKDKYGIVLDINSETLENDIIKELNKLL